MYGCNLGLVWYTQGHLPVYSHPMSTLIVNCDDVKDGIFGNSKYGLEIKR
jgi:hypothetical protein